MSYSVENPGAGNTSEINGFSLNQGSRSTSSTDVSSRLSAIAHGPEAFAWQGASATAWRERIARVHPMLDAASQVALSWSAAAETYRSVVESIATRAEVQNHKIETAQTMLRAYSWMPVEVTGTPEYQTKINNYEGDVVEATQALWTLLTERETADTTFATALNAHTAAGEQTDWVTLQALYGDANTLADLDAAREAVIAEANELADAMKGHGPDPEDVEALTALLNVMAADPTLAGNFWDGRGGDDALTVLQMGLRTYMDPTGAAFNTDEEEAAALAYARAIRGSLASGSTTWTDAEARDFAAQMVTGDDWPGGGDFNASAYQGIGFLFDDAANHPMGEKLTVATADLIDAWERAEGEPGVARGTSMSGPDASRAWFNALSAADQEDRGGYNSESYGDTPGSSVQDPMSRVLDTLGTYPDAAWEWLSADGDTLANGLPAAATDKVDYYATRDWTNDGFDGFGSLWESSMRADGGLASDTYDAATWSDQCDVASRIVSGVDNGGYFAAGVISSEGATHMGNAVAQLIPFVEYQLWTDVSAPGDGQSQTFTPDSAFIAAQSGTMPYLDPAVFGDLVTTLVSHDNGFVPIRQAVTQVQNELIYYADARGTYEAWDDSLARIASLEANFEGAVGGSDILQARLDDDRIRAQMAVAQLPLNFLPSAGFGAVVDVGIQEGLGLGIDDFTERYLATNEGLANSQLDSSQLAGAAGLELKIHLLDQDPNCSLNSVHPQEKSRDEWFGTFLADHDDSYYSSVWKSTDNV